MCGSLLTFGLKPHGYFRFLLLFSLFELLSFENTNLWICLYYATQNNKQPTHTLFKFTKENRGKKAEIVLASDLPFPTLNNTNSTGYLIVWSSTNHLHLTMEGYSYTIGKLALKRKRHQCQLFTSSTSLSSILFLSFPPALAPIFLRINFEGFKTPSLSPLTSLLFSFTFCLYPWDLKVESHDYLDCFSTISNQLA